MGKSRWWVVVWLGLVASAGALASNVADESGIKTPASINERQTTMSGVDAVAFVATATNPNQGSTGMSKLPSRAGYDTSAVPGPSSLPFILAGLGALAVAATRRRTR